MACHNNYMQENYMYNGYNTNVNDVDFIRNNFMNGQVNNYENHYVIAGQEYGVQNENYYDNYHHRYNHYYITDVNYVADHYMDHNVYHHNTNNVYNGEDYLGAENVFVYDDENGVMNPVGNFANANNFANAEFFNQNQRRPCNNSTVRRIPCGNNNNNNKCNCCNQCNCCNKCNCCNQCNCNKQENKCNCKCNCKCKCECKKNNKCRR